MSPLDAAFQPDADPQRIADQYAADADDRAARRDGGEHCRHHEYDDLCGGYYDDCDRTPDDDVCVGCDCHCTDPGIQYAKGDR